MESHSTHPHKRLNKGNVLDVCRCDTFELDLRSLCCGFSRQDLGSALIRWVRALPPPGPTRYLDPAGEEDITVFKIKTSRVIVSSPGTRGSRKEQQMLSGEIRPSHSHRLSVWTGPGTYECAFVIGPVMYTAKAQMNVALLPDEITMKINPLIVNCAESSNVSIKATIADTTETYDVNWHYSVSKLTDLKNTTSSGNIDYSAMAHIKCDQPTEEQYVRITFKNNVNQEKSEQYTIPIIYENTKVCSDDNSDGIWPKTPDGTTVTIHTCENNTVGHKTRTCKGREWLPVFNSCVDKKLSEVVSEAEYFEKGMGASQDLAKNVFEGLKNFSTSETTESTANVIGVIKVLDVMATASKTFAMTEEILPNFVESASNILDKNWQGVNDSYIHTMSSQYLKSVEGLVKYIKVKNTNNVATPNINFEVCSGSDCNLKVFGINVTLHNGTKVVKTVGLKNLIHKLPNNYQNSEQLSDKIIVVTQEEESTSPFKITLDFPNKPPGHRKPLCVYWDTEKEDWSEEGCTVKSSINGSTLCECNHLTAFSILMGKGNTPDPTLDIITYTGLAVSICSLIIFLIIEYLVWSALIKSNLSHFRHTAMVNIASFRLLADCSFLASIYPEILTDEWCLILTICKHVFYLAMFSWMLCLSVMLVHQIIFVFSPLRKRVFMFFSSIVGYVCPILIVGTSYLFCKYTKTKYYEPDKCWLVYDGPLQGSMYAFLLPVGTITLTNLFSMVVVILTLMKTAVPGGSQKQDKETAKSIFKVVLYLTPVFGITWAFGFLLRVLNEDHPAYLFANYTFTILNTFQGLFILITGCFTETKVREELITLITRKKKARDGVDIEDNPHVHKCSSTCSLQENMSESLVCIRI
ncbi:adhesion G-protein coupled receptor F1-like [Solea senegalensis]|uniref:Adhesion G-protein coupled receptor F1-like n=1 Tax=Solea senegalensis TaxID=28829 RepID=A0AAV6RVY9_SOLSE|nr:adhesion G-protein coupled receptor F1-like [Solea senegalensis]